MKLSLCSVAEIPPDSAIKVDFFGREALVYLVDGRPRAVANICMHLGGPLAQQGERFVCAWHGATFQGDLKGGTMERTSLHTGTRTARPTARLDQAGWALRLNGGLLATTGLAALTADLIGYFFAAGPFARLYGQPLTIGGAEAHGLAALIGLLLLRNAQSPHRWGWHLIALTVHLFLGVSNLLFWPVYSIMGIMAAGVVSTIFHALLISIHLACIALADEHLPAEPPTWLRTLRRSGLYVRAVAIGTLLLGAGVHIAIIVFGRAVLPRILTPVSELLMTVLMYYVGVAGWLAWRRFHFQGRWHQLVLAGILIYFLISIPFHALTVVTGSTAHYDRFPEQYSKLIVPVMLSFVAGLASLRLRQMN